MNPAIIARVNQTEISELPKDLYISPQALKIFLDMFEGPLDLLLYLIRKQNLDILAIPIVDIANQYLQYIDAMQELNFDLASEYLLMAAILIEIKSRMLLPRKNDNPDEPDTDPRVDLINRLIEYERIKLGAIALGEIPVAQADFMWVSVKLEELVSLEPALDIALLQKAFTNLLKQTKLVKPMKLHKQQLSLRETMTHIIKRLGLNQTTNFLDLFDISQGVPHVVVNFLAILELAKDGMIWINASDERIELGLA